MEQRLLYVEDNDDNAFMLAKRLGRLGYVVQVARDGREGVAHAQQDMPDLIIMDLGLPEMDGLEATRQLKAMPATRHIPIIALTAHAMKGDDAKAIEAGCDDYDTKPVELPRLIKKIKTLLGP